MRSIILCSTEPLFTHYIITNDMAHYLIGHPLEFITPPTLLKNSFKELFYRKINIENVYIFVMTSSLNFSRLVTIQANRFCFLKKTSFLI